MTIHNLPRVREVFGVFEECHHFFNTKIGQGSLEGKPRSFLKSPFALLGTLRLTFKATRKRQTTNFKSYFDFNSLVFEFRTICTVFCIKIEA